MHAVALTVTEVFAVGTLVTTHPFTIAVQHIAVLPYIHEVILIDVALIVVCADAGTGSDGTVGHHGAHADAGLTGEETVAHLAFVVAEKTLTAVVCPNATLLAYLFNIFEHSSELLIREPHHGIEGCASDGEDRKGR